MDADGHLRIKAFLNASAQRLAVPDIRCEACREVQDHIDSRPPATGGLRTRASTPSYKGAA
jgi:hypothetical protein